MAALQALRPAVSGVVRNPIVLLITALFGGFQLPNLLVQSTSPVLASAISLVTFGVMILVLPFFQGGLLGMADEAIAGEARLGTLVAVGKANYVPLLLGYFVLLAVNMIFGFLAFMGAIIVIIGGSIAGMGGGVGTGMGGGAGTGVDAPVVGFHPTLLAVVGVVAVGLVLAYLLVTFFVQFYAHAVVLDGSELVDGFRRSAGLVRSNLLSVFGYTVLLLVGSLLVGTLAAAASFVVGPQPPGSPIAELVPFDPSTGVVVVGAIGYVLLTGMAGAFYATYSVAFYRRISGTVAN